MTQLTAAIDIVAARASDLQARFEHIAHTRMAGLPMLHPGLRVKAVGFEPDADGLGAWGVLVTPWFMNLVWFATTATDMPPLRVGDSRRRVMGNAAFDCIGGHEDGFGAYEACSLFSPMAEFADQAGAEATAEAVLQQLRTPPAAEPAARAPSPSRRAWLFGRGSAAQQEAA